MWSSGEIVKWVFGDVCSGEMEDHFNASILGNWLGVFSILFYFFVSRTEL